MLDDPTEKAAERFAAITGVMGEDQRLPHLIDQGYTDLYEIRGFVHPVITAQCIHGLAYMFVALCPGTDSVFF